MCFKSPCLERIKLALKILPFAFAPVQQVDKSLICHQRLRITGLPAGNSTAFGKRTAPDYPVTRQTPAACARPAFRRRRLSAIVERARRTARSADMSDTTA